MQFLEYLIFFGLISFNLAQIFSRSKMSETDDKEPILTDLTKYFGKPDLETGIRLKNLNESVNPEEVGSYLEGDILLPNDDGRASLLNESYRWPRGVVPYVITGSFTTRENALILRAIREYATRTCIRFVRRTNQRDFISIENNDTGCWSIVGRVGSRQRMNLQSPGCVTKIGTIEHEMMHALGFFHEHTREDRDNYVTITRSNIEEMYKHNFDKVDKGTTTDYGVRYAFGSVMHYSRRAFAIDKSKDTITPKVNDPDINKIGQRDDFAPQDIYRIKRMYKCS